VTSSGGEGLRETSRSVGERFANRLSIRNNMPPRSAKERFPRKQPERSEGKTSDMTYVIAEPCIGTKDNSCVEVCPVDACFAEDQLPPEWEKYTQLNADYFAQK
jgi:NAD-dependent dihydropyrimidine dehydrogenase PreA subunit